MLDDGRSRWAQLQILEGQYLQMSRDRGGELAGAEQEIGIARLAEALIALGESLIEQQPAGRDGTDDVGQDGPVQIIRHQHQVEAAAA